MNKLRKTPLPPQEFNANQFTFTDNAGRTWDLTLTLAGARRIDNSDFSAFFPEKFSILEPDQKLLNALLVKSSFLFAVIWAIVQPQVAAAEITEEEFLDGLDGATISKARLAFWESLKGFFQGEQTGVSAYIDFQSKLNQKASQALLRVSPEMEKRADELLQREEEQAIQTIRALDVGKAS